MGFSVVMTSDHGSIRVQNDVMVAADRNASSGVRYKYGRNLNTNEKHALVIKEPEKYRLPVFGEQPSYVLQKMITILFIRTRHINIKKNSIILFNMAV